MAKTPLLIIEDYEPIVTLLRSTLSDEFEVTVANSAEEAVVLLGEQSPPLVLLDIGLPPHASPEQGLLLLQAMQQQGSRCRIVVCTGYNERDLALRALRFGAFDILHKPLDLAVLKGVLRRAGWLAELDRDAARETDVIPPMTDDLISLIGTSASMRPIHDAVRKIAGTDLPVLITGEAGTGKAFLARTIHQHSHRAHKPLARIACGAIPGVLLERELFGDSLDGSGRPPSRVKGAVESSGGGTLFLEDLAELPTDLQGELVRRLEQSVVEARVRLIASSRDGLKEAVEQGRVRRDLYEKFAMHINVPALRDRGADVLVLGTVFLRRFARQQSKTIAGFTKDAMERMRTYSWPGNVAELAVQIQRAVVLADGRYIEAQDLGLSGEEGALPPNSISLKVNQQRIETDLIMRAFTLSRGNLSRAAHELGISRSTLYRRIRQYGLDRAPAKLSS